MFKPHTGVVGLAVVVVLVGCSGPGSNRNGTMSEVPPKTVEPKASAIEQLVITPAGACAVLRSRSVACWGIWHQALVKVAAPASQLHEVVEIDVGTVTFSDPQTYFDHLCTRDTKGLVRCWGNNRENQLGSGGGDSLKPSLVTGLGSTTQLALGGKHTCAIAGKGEVFCWGSNKHGQLGIGKDKRVARAPIRVPGLDRVTMLDATHEYSCALDARQRVLCWGQNFHSQSDPTIPWLKEKIVWFPREIQAARGSVKLSIGAGIACVLKADRTVMCWGRAKKPALVAGVSDATAITVGDFHACALRAAGTVTCWGDNEHAQLGNGSRDPRRSAPRAPHDVQLPGKVVSLVAGPRDTCARMTDRRWFCWGRNRNGQIAPATLRNGYFIGQPQVSPVQLDLSRLDLVTRAPLASPWRWSWRLRHRVCAARAGL